jgi:glucose-1-phosphate cytidylyltransferase
MHRKRAEVWRVTLVETGDDTMTGGRLRHARDYLGDEPFRMTYGDGLADLDFDRLLQCHRASSRLATLTAVQQSGRWGVLDLDEASQVRSFREKADIDAGWINGGVMVLSAKILDYIDGDGTVFEQDTLVRLSAVDQLGAFRHPGAAPWRIW